ncbi:MAG TPA: hypothetical protein H9902_01305, partial [Candidatus Stackebrandtia faecavium]|nr:hypothetical protein [Candidatus Stackebrandtia faecavium]
MTITIGELGAEPAGEPQGGVGALHTAKGNLPLRRLAIDADVTGMSFRAVMTQEFHNDHSESIEATYIFPLPDRAATTSMVFTAADRTVTAQLKERARARREYDEA